MTLVNTLKRPLRPIKHQAFHYVRRVRDYVRYGSLAKYITFSQEIPGWTGGNRLISRTVSGAAGGSAKSGWQR